MGNGQSFDEQKVIYEESLYMVEGKQLQSVFHRSIGGLTFLNSKKKSCAGTGMLISPNLVLTVAHNIYDKINSLNDNDRSDACLLQYELDKSAFKFYVGGDHGEDYYQVADWKYLSEYRTCPSSNKLKLDYSLIKLRTNVEYKQFLQLSLPCLMCLNEKKQPLQIFGYPLYKDNYETLKDKWGKKIKLVQYGLARENKIALFSPQQCKIGYAITTCVGHSGSPIVTNQKIIAIHNGGGRQNQQFNIGRLVTVDLISNLIKWAKELNAIPFKINKNFCIHQQHLLDNKNIFGEEDYYRSQIKVQKNRQMNFKEENQQKSMISQTNQNVDIEQQLDFDHNDLQEINLSSYIYLKELSLQWNNIVSVDLHHNRQLKKLWLSGNQLQNIDLSKNTNLTVLYLYKNCLQGIDLATNIYLAELSLQHNCLTAIDLSKNTKLTKLSLFSNKISAIDLTSNSKLTQLELYANKLRTAVVWYSPQLSQLALSDQSSQKCEITLLYHRKEFSQCRELFEERIVKYNSDSSNFNKHGCRYIFKMKEFS